MSVPEVREYNSLILHLSEVFIFDLQLLRPICSMCIFRLRAIHKYSIKYESGRAMDLGIPMKYIRLVMATQYYSETLVHERSQDKVFEHENRVGW